MCYVFNDDGLKHYRCHKWWSTNGQDANYSKTSDFEHGFETRGAGPSRVVNEVGAIDNLRLENQLTELTSLVGNSLSANISKMHKVEFVEYALLWST
ncbi:hypothetical protein CR513_22644, partial [Mucuna pruriens]